MERLEIEARRHAQDRANRERGPMLIYSGPRNGLRTMWVRSVAEGAPDAEDPSKLVLLDTIQPDQQAPAVPMTCDCMDCTIAGENTH